MRLAAFAIVISMASVTTVRAQPADKTKGAAADGEAKFKARDYAGAAETFRLAYSLDADPGYLFNIAQAYRFARDCKRSAEYYRQFLKKVPRPPNLAQVTGWLADQDACIRAFATSTVADAHAKLDSGRYLDAAELFKTAYQLDANPDLLFKVAEAYRLAHDCSNAADYYRRFLTSVPSPPNVDEVKRSIVEQDECAKTQTLSSQTLSSSGWTPGPGKRRLAIIATGTGVVALGVAAFFTWDIHRLTALRDACTEIAPCTAENWAGYADRGNRDTKIAITGYAIGGAAMVGGVVLFLLARPGHERPVAIAPTSGGAMVVGGFGF